MRRPRARRRAAAGSSSGNPLSGVGLLMRQSPRVTWPASSRSTRSSRNGLVARSRPMEVCSPWPGSTTMSSGSGSTLVAQAAQHGRVVAAGQVGAADRAGEQQVAGEHHLGDVVGRRTAYGRSPSPRCGRACGRRRTASPASSRRCAVGQLARRRRARRTRSRRRAASRRSRATCRPSGRPAGAGRRGGSRRWRRRCRPPARPHHMWSMWPWVTSTATGLSRCSRTTSATPSAASLPGSMTTHSAPGPVATT